MNDAILFLEELSMNAHPAIRTHLYDGWILRFADGYTHRANSVNPLYPGRIAPQEKVAFCEAMYATQGLPAVFKLTPASPQGLDGLLERKGYERVTPTVVMRKELAAVDDARSVTTVTDRVDPTWRESFFRLNGIAEARKRRAAATLQDSIRNRVFCGTIEERGQAVACGLCVLERGMAGLFDIAVDASCRRRGYGLDLCRSLLGAAWESGARAAYLQVVDGNEPARALYRRLGFVDHHPYWYRVK